MLLHLETRVSLLAAVEPRATCPESRLHGHVDCGSKLRAMEYRSFAAFLGSNRHVCANRSRQLKAAETTLFGKKWWPGPAAMKKSCERAHLIVS
jgi:hypothetical protein